MKIQYDAIIIGGGHNGLVNGCYLARAGLRTLVLEKRHLVGGAAITEELLPGFQFTTFSYAVSLLRPDIVQDLELTRHGLMILPMPNTFQPGFNGEYLFLGADSDSNYHEIARHSASDAEGYKDLSHLINQVCFALQPWMDQIPPNSLSNDPADIKQMQAIEQCMGSMPSEVKGLFEKFISGSAAVILDEYLENDLVKAMIASSGIIGSKCSPRSKESGLVWLVHKMGEYDGVLGDWGFHRRGNGGLTQTLARAFESFGGEIRLGSSVKNVLYVDNQVTGVELEGGDCFYANNVVSALDPRRTFKQLVDPMDLPNDLVEAIDAYKFQGTAAKVNFALTGLPTFPGLEGRRDIFQGFVNIGPSLDYLEEAFEDCQSGTYSRRPFIDCCVQSVIDPSMAPPGKHVMSCFVMYAPFELQNSDWETERENFGDVTQATLEEFFPGFDDLVLHREVVTPKDIEDVTGLSEGNIFAFR